jgi:peptide/nickel transport system permease protein
MSGYVARRAGFLLLMVWAALTLNFIIPRLMPGDPAQIMLAHIGAKGSITPALRSQLAASLGLPGGSVLSQYGQYLNDVVHFRFGLSYAYFPQPVSSLISSSLPWTLLLVGVVTVVSFIAGTAIGVAAAWNRNKRFDSVATVGSTFASSFPYFWTGLLLLYVFAFRYSWLPMSGGSANPPSWSLSFAGDALQHSVLPGLTIFISGIGAWALGMRNYTISVLGEDFIKFAQANGVRTRILLTRYAMRNAVLPQLTVFAILFGNVVGGSLLVEEVFGYPGVGTLLYNAIFSLDYPLMQALFLIITVCVLLANFAVDMLHVRLDPRIAR